MGPASAPPQQAVPSKTEKKRGKTRGLAGKIRTHWWQILIVVIVLVGVGFFVQNYLHTKNELKKLSDTKTAAQASDQQLVSEVSKYVVLPENETPTVATVNDVNKLKDQVFFQNAQNGDKVLIFSQAKTAVLYRPSAKKIVEYAPINVDVGSSGTSTAPKSNTTPKQ